MTKTDLGCPSAERAYNTNLWLVSGFFRQIHLHSLDMTTMLNLSDVFSRISGRFPQGYPRNERVTLHRVSSRRQSGVVLKNRFQINPLLKNGFIQEYTTGVAQKEREKVFEKGFIRYFSSVFVPIE